MKKGNKIIILISMGIIVLINLLNILTFSKYEKLINDKENLDNLNIAFYKGNEKLEEMPSKENSEDIEFIKGKCDNEAEIEWNSEEWAPLIKNLSKSKTKCSLYFGKVIELGKNIKPVENGNGLYAVTHEDLEELESVWNKTEYRYAGANVDNYIDIADNELWRVIGLVNVKTKNGIEQRLKIVRDNVIGGYSWDTSNEEVNTGWGINEWSESDLMKLLNPGYENYIENEIRVNNSLFWHRESGTCYNGINNRTTTTACDFTNNGLSEKSKSYIEEVTWNLGGFAGGNINAKRAYEAERGTNVVFEPADYIVRKNEWNGKVALMYPSDYGYAVGGDKRNTCLSNGLYYYDINDCATSNWLYNKVYTWLLSPSLTATDPYYIFSNGGVNHYNGAFFSYAVRPTVYLKSDVKILASDKPNYGSINNPFKII